ncbi:hypothetical protein A4X09_0g5953 [Tilletia walkeri]|uniref:Uncharacterized protein n=1 Tax=Tilletia walkeri TaxID=117179 RepID=A0A8X7T352_9BASI|nr:hypothetical protein A4X09_0g5953 [Tilletia walkeri]
MRTPSLLRLLFSIAQAAAFVISSSSNDLSVNLSVNSTRLAVRQSGSPLGSYCDLDSNCTSSNCYDNHVDEGRFCYRQFPNGTCSRSDLCGSSNCTRGFCVGSPLQGSCDLDKDCAGYDPDPYGYSEAGTLHVCRNNKCIANIGASCTQNGDCLRAAFATTVSAQYHSSLLKASAAARPAASTRHASKINLAGMTMESQQSASGCRDALGTRLDTPARTMVNAVEGSAEMGPVSLERMARLRLGYTVH